MKWFGKRHGSAVYRDCPEVGTPVGASCGRCEESIEAGDDGFILNVVMHRACFLRMTLGSAAHLMETCSCFVKNSVFPHDPPNLTRRQAAELVLQIVEGRAN